MTTRSYLAGAVLALCFPLFTSAATLQSIQSQLLSILDQISVLRMSQVSSVAATADTDTSFYDFGGMYGFAPGAIYRNPATNAASCPTGYTKSPVLGTAGFDFDAYFCYRPNVAGSSSILDFGGTYGYAIGNVTYTNPATSAGSCPPGFIATPFIGSSIDYPGYSCYRWHTTNSTHFFDFGGMYGFGGGGTVYKNPATNAASCPSGYTAAPVIGSAGFDYNIYSCYRVRVAPNNASCTFGNATVPHGGSITAYAQSSVPAGSVCQSQTRTCTNGVLSGTYAFASCVPQSGTVTNDLVRPQIAPSSAATLSATALVSILNGTGPNTAYHAAAGVTSSGVSSDALKVIQTGMTEYPYLGVFHQLVGGGLFDVKLAKSSDLKTWTTLGTVSATASMGDLRLLPDGSVLYAHEFNPTGNRPYIQVRHYTSIASFVSNPQSPARSFNVPFSLGASADGTPAFGRITYSGNILSSSIELYYHYFENGVKDRQGKGTITNFAQWSGGPNTSLNSSLDALGYTHIGDRDIIKVGSTFYMVLEANPAEPVATNGWDKWRLFLVNLSTGAVTQLSPVISGGAYSVGNPTTSFVTLPDGRNALVFGKFIFSEGRAQTPAGERMYVYPL